jgi:hypothetical protein
VAHKLFITDDGGCIEKQWNDEQYQGRQDMTIAIG